MKCAFWHRQFLHTIKNQAAKWKKKYFCVHLKIITRKVVLKSYELEFMGGQKLTEIIHYKKIIHYICSLPTVR